MMGDSHLPLDWFKIHLVIDLPFSISVSFQRGWTEGKRPFLVFEAQSDELGPALSAKGKKGQSPLDNSVLSLLLGLSRVKKLLQQPSALLITLTFQPCWAILSNCVPK